MEKVTSFAMKRVLFAGAIAAAVALMGTKVLADDASDIEQFYANNSYVQWDNTAGYPIVTAVGSQPSVLGGHTYTGWSVFAADASGSMDLFISQGTLTNMPGSPPTSISAGDELNVAGQWSPFHSLPELAFSTVPASNNYFTTVSTGNSLPAPPVYTVNDLNTSGMGANYAPGNLGIAGYYLTVSNVTITGSLAALPGYVANVAPTVAQETFTMTDNTGSMTMFDWVTSYSASDLLAGTPVGEAYTYNVEGFVSYNGTLGPLEFTPLALQAVPEPSTVLLVGTGLLGLLAIRRRRS